MQLVRYGNSNNSNINSYVNDGQEVDIDDDIVPVFFDLYNSKPTSTTSKNESSIVPKLLHPLIIHKHDGPGRMVEEWELSADENTNRIMLHDCMKDVASLIVTGSTTTSTNTDTNIDNTNNDERKGKAVLVTGENGVGKSTVLASIVAMARNSNHLVLFMPDCDRLSKLGYYVEPNLVRVWGDCSNSRSSSHGSNNGSDDDDATCYYNDDNDNINPNTNTNNNNNNQNENKQYLYDLPMLAKEICDQFLQSHCQYLDFWNLHITEDQLKQYLSLDQNQDIRNLIVQSNTDDGDDTGDDGNDGDGSDKKGNDYKQFRMYI